jgi:putative tryptophan/tyrosine transport system substrate-binding protein
MRLLAAHRHAKKLLSSPDRRGLWKDRMRRRDFMAGSAATATLGVAGWPVYADINAGSPAPKRIALLHVSLRPEEAVTSIRAYYQELSRLGYIEGKNLTVDRYWGLGQYDRTEEIVRAIVDSRPDLILATTGTVARALKPLTTTIPILAITGDPVAGGIVTSMARPGGNITGVSVDAGFELYGKLFQYLVETAPRLANVRILWATTTRWLWETTALGALRDAAGRTGISIDAAWVSPPVDQAAYEKVFEAMKRDRVDGLIVGGDHFAYRQLIADLTARYRLPAIYPSRDFVDAGGLLSYGIDLHDVYRRLAVMTNQVLRGAKPGDIPYYQLTKFDLVLNRATARLLGLDFPPTLLATAADIIE